MKKELFALFLLIVIIGFSVFNSLFISAIAEKAEKLVLLSTSSAESVVDAEKLFSDNRAYLGAVLRHSELDAISDGFYELKKALVSGDGAQSELAAERLIARLHAMERMEILRLDSIF